ncbi:trans-2-enoyl-CoA reductase family protein [Pseudovibrio exalbescens]|uniref:enoyl-ACP reductase FabV n=1 Tax=Pseudovibrio exalbescens TaxID=197461 RepID=UPI002365EA03|nr:enoyl-ACP reductase FabV [Pseudovibrio exalbescens]MDD7912149.1 trans-2-enoyl-CoA reductase family protein [Pseudovibrio exalbescens]
MIIESKIDGVVARTCHPLGCKQAVLDQIAFVEGAPQIIGGPKKVLILGASSGYGLASRISLAFGGCAADTIGVSFERGPNDKGIGTAGWYNNVFFREEAERKGLIAKNFVGDAFSPQMRADVIDFIRSEFGGTVDMVIYSLATGVRPDPETGERMRSTIKPLGDPVSGTTINLEHDRLDEMTLPPATEQEVQDTVRVMGGEDWRDWISELADAGVLAKGCATLAYSYVGPEFTYEIYHDGTLGHAKAHLHATADQITEMLKPVGGQAHVAVCKALVTKASVFIPTFSPYITVLFRVMKEKGLHEGCIEQMQRMFVEKIYGPEGYIVDDENLLRLDDWELRADVQAEAKELLSQITPENFAEIGDYAGYKQEFLALNGFGLENVDYTQEVDPEALKGLQP